MKQLILSLFLLVSAGLSPSAMASQFVSLNECTLKSANANSHSGYELTKLNQVSIVSMHQQDGWLGLNVNDGNQVNHYWLYLNSQRGREVEQQLLACNQQA